MRKGLAVEFHTPTNCIMRRGRTVAQDATIMTASHTDFYSRRATHSCYHFRVEHRRLVSLRYRH